MKFPIVTNFFRQGSFLHNVTLLASGTAIAQLGAILVSPILTRLYTPKDFGLLAVFMAIVASVAPAVTGSFEMALVLPKLKKMALELYSLAVWCALGISFFLFLLIVFFQDYFLRILDAPGLSGLILFVPVVLLVTGLFNLASYMSNRSKQFKFLSKAKIIQMLCAVTLNLGFGVMGFGVVGLVIGNFTGLFVGFLYLTFTQKDLLKQISFQWNRNKKLAVSRFSQFPLLDASSGLLNGFTLSLPTYFLSSMYSDSVVGYYSLMLRVVGAPFGVISNAIFQVYLRSVVDIAGKGGNIVALLKKVGFCLLIIALLPTVVLSLWGPSLFSFVFGQEWRVAGEYAQIMTCALSVRFVASILSATFVGANNPKYALFRRISSLIMVSIALLVAYYLNSVYDAIWALTISMILDDLIAFSLIYRTALKVNGGK